MKTLILTISLLFSLNISAQVGYSKSEIENKLELDKFNIVVSNPIYTVVKIKGGIDITFIYNEFGKCSKMLIYNENKETIKAFLKRNGFNKLNEEVYIDETRVALFTGKDKDYCEIIKK